MASAHSIPRTSAARSSYRLAVVAGCAVTVTVVAAAVAAGTQGSDWRAWDGDYTDLRVLAFWLISSISEPQYYASASAGVCLVLGGWFAHLARRGSSPWAGFVQACGTGIWPAVAAGSLGSLVLGNLVWGWTLGDAVWQPLFVPLVSVAPAMVVLYGPGLRSTLTGVVLGGLLTPPIAVLAVEHVTAPLELPAVVGATSGMWGGALVAFGIARHLPWMPRPGAWRTGRPGGAPAAPASGSPVWIVRRALADFSEAQFFGNEWASAAMLLGVLVAYAVNPAGLVYGSGLLGAVLLSQALAAVIGVTVWRHRWQELGFYPTFVPVVSVAPATVLAFGGTAPSVVAGAVAGALVAPPVAAAISARLPADFHPFVGNVLSMSICTAAIVPLLDLLPGIAS